MFIFKKRLWNAIIGGIKNAKGNYIIMCDRDGSYDMDNLMPFLEKLRQSYDLVMGNRYRGGFEKESTTTSYYIGVKFLTHFANMLHGTRLGVIIVD